MINYKLAKKLKEAGFPQHNESIISGKNDEEKLDLLKYFYHSRSGFHSIFDSSYCLTDLEYYNEYPVEEWVGKARAAIYFTKEYIESEEGKFLIVYIPTLSELIEACGDRFQKLETVIDTEGSWRGVGGKGIRDLEIAGKTPEEAVANLWLELNKK